MDGCVGANTGVVPGTPGTHSLSKWDPVSGPEIGGSPTAGPSKTLPSPLGSFWVVGESGTMKSGDRRSFRGLKDGRAYPYRHRGGGGYPREGVCQWDPV